MDLWNSLAGMVEVEVTSAKPEAVLGAANGKNIVIFSVQRIGDLTVRFRILRGDFRTLAALCEKRGEKLRVVKRKGLYWLGKRLLKRPLAAAGILFFLFLALFLPTRVLFIQVEGNQTVPDNRILAAAEESGICFFASRREVRSEKMKNALLSAVPELQWAGVNTSGCVATISVRERTEPASQPKETIFGNIVAARDGIIQSCTATLGNLLCKPGQAVKQGQILISGYTDCGICIQATGAQGEIYAQTSRSLTSVTPSQWISIGDINRSETKYSLLIGKKRINLWKDSGIWDGTCGRMYEEYYITLPGGFRMPVALIVERYVSYETEAVSLSEEDAQDILAEFSRKCLMGQMIAGSIQSSRERVFSQEGVLVLEGEYICSEMIGRVRTEQIGENNG